MFIEVWAHGRDGATTLSATHNAVAPLPPFFSARQRRTRKTPKAEKFSLHFFQMRAPDFFLKRKENFSGFGTEIFEENFRAEAGRRLNQILEKSSSLVVNSHCFKK